MSSSWFNQTTLFSAYAAVCDGEDADIPRGTHLRVFPSAEIGFPLAPMGIWNLPAQRMQPLDFFWSDRRGHPVATPNLDLAGGELIGTLKSAIADNMRLVGLEVRFAGGAGAEGQVTLLHRVQPSNCTISQRSRDRWLVGAPNITSVRVRGRGVATVIGWLVSTDLAFEKVAGSAPIATLSAPIDRDMPWYVGGEGADRAMDHLRSGAPLRLTPPDQPDGPFDPLTPFDEEKRVSTFRGELDAEFEMLVRDPATSPAFVEQVHVGLAADLSPGKRRPWQRVKLNVRDSLMMKSVDPGAARYLGLLTRLDSARDGLDAAGQPTSSVWLAAGVFACGPLDPQRIPAPDPFEKRLLDRLVAQTPALRRTLDRAIRSGLTPRVFVAAALAAPVPDRPAAPNVSLGSATWIRADEGLSTEFRQQFLVDKPDLAPLVALGRLSPGGWETRHDLVGQPPRAATRILGQLDGQSRLRTGQRGLIDDTPIDADASPWTYRVALGDIFGRFGAGTDITVPLPARPPLPAPTLRARVAPAERAVHRGPADSGTLHLQMTVPPSNDLTAGSLALALAITEFEGITLTQPAPLNGGALEFEFTTPPLLPMEARRLQATARFQDVDGNLGPTAVIDVDIADPRAPLVPETGIGIVWSSRPGPAEEVEFKLHFAGAAGVRYRVYMSDAGGLGISATDGERRRTRAEIAMEGAQLGLDGIALRDRFRLLTDKPLQPAGGRVLLQTRLPRAMETVQFLRFVPVSDRGAEADFAACPLLPIAVPSDRQPPAPRVEVDVDGDTGVAHVTITAIGLDLIALRASEPGLFDEPADASARAPGWRLRRASGAIPDAVYAREVGRGSLAFDGEAFKATVDDSPTANGLLPYVRWFYWADVRMPAERRLPPGVIEVPLPVGGVEPTQPAQREDAPGAASLPSAPAVAMFVPATVPELAEAMCNATVAALAGGIKWKLTLTVAGGPVAHARAVGRYSVAIHLQIDGGDFIPEPAAQPFEDGVLAFSAEGPGAVPAVRIALILIDPLGREGAPLFVTAVAV